MWIVEKLEGIKATVVCLYDRQVHTYVHNGIKNVFTDTLEGIGL